MTSLDMHGFSLSLLPLSDAAATSSLIALFDAQCSSCAWPRTSPFPPSVLPPPPPTCDVQVVAQPRASGDCWSASQVMISVCRRMIAEGGCRHLLHSRCIFKIINIRIVFIVTNIRFVFLFSPAAQAPCFLNWTQSSLMAIWATRFPPLSSSSSTSNTHTPYPPPPPPRTRTHHIMLLLHLAHAPHLILGPPINKYQTVNPFHTDLT